MKRTLTINPPPQNHRCEVCGKKADLFKTFREVKLNDMQSFVEPSWECESCLKLGNNKRILKRAGLVE